MPPRKRGHKSNSTNNFAISSEGIGEALQRSAAALSQANNDLDKSIALVVAANNVVQNPEAVGTALRTVALRIRGAKDSLNELGEDTDGMAESVSKLRDELLALSGVDIMIDDSTFKDTYQIMLDLARVWDSLTDVTQANILEKIAGKRGANAVASILSNVKDLEAAYVASQNAQGSALAENQKYLESIEGRLSQLSATWQEFWDNAMNSDVVKTIISALDALLQFINSIGGLNTAIITLGLSTFIMDLGKLRTRLVGLVKHVANLGSGLSKLGTELKASGTGWGQLFKSAFSGKDIGTFSSKKMVDVVASSYNSALKGSEGDMSAAMLAKQEAMGLMLKQYPDLTDKSRKLAEAMLDEAAATGSTVNKTQKAAAAQQVYTAQMKAGKTATDAMTAAQMALKVALSIGIGIAIGAVINKVSTWIEKQNQLRQEIIETGKKESEQARNIRDAIRGFKEVNERYKDHKASQEDLEPAIRKVTEAFGDQAAMLKGLKEGGEEWIEMVEKMEAAANNNAKRSAADAMALASDTTKWYDKYAGPLSAYFAYRSRQMESYEDSLVEQLTGVRLSEKLEGGNWRTGLPYLINDYNRLQQKIEAVNKEIEKNEELLVKYEALGTEDGDKAAASIRESINNYSNARLEFEKRRAKMTADDTELKQFFDNIGAYFDATYTPDTFKEYLAAIDKFADDLHRDHGILKSDISAIMDVVNSSNADFQYFQNAIDSTHEFLASTELVKLSAQQLFDAFGDDVQMLNQITSNAFRDYLANNNQVIESIDQLTAAHARWQEQLKQDAIAENTLFDAINKNKDAIDKFQETVSKLGGIMNASYSGNAGGLLDDLQSLVEIIGGIGGDEANEFIDKLNEAGYSLESLQTAMKEVSGDLLSDQLDKIIDELAIAKPELAGLTGVLKDIVAEAQQLEAVTQSLDGLKSTYQSVTDVIKQYNEAGILNADSISKLLSLSNEYLGLLKFENGQLKLNEEALREMFLARLDELEAQIDATHQSRIESIYKQAAAKATDIASEANADFTKGLVLEAIAAEGATAELENLKDAVEDYQMQLGSRDARYESLNDEYKAMIDGADAAWLSQKESIDKMRAGTTQMINDFLGMTDSVVESAEDAAGKLKSAIDTVLSHYKNALDSGAISWKQYLSKMKNILDTYGDQLSLEDRLNLQRDYAQAELDMWSAGKDAFERYIDRTMIKPIEKSKKALEDQRDALEENKEAIEKYYDAITKGLEKQKKAIEDEIEAIEKSYEAQIKPLEKQQKAIEKQTKAIEKRKRAIEDEIAALEKTKKPYEKQQKAIDRQIKEVQKQLDALEASKKPYEDQQAAIEKQIKSIEKQIKAIQDTEKPYKDQQKALQKEQKEIQKSIRAIEDKISAMEELKAPYQEQLDVINKEIAALEHEVALLERTKKPYQDRQQAIQNEIDAIEYEIAVKQRAEKSYKREQDVINREVQLLERQVTLLERRKKPYEDAQKEIERQIELLQDEQDALEDLKKPYQDEIEALEKEKAALQEANEERKNALDLQQAEYNLQRAQNQRTNLVYQGGQFQYVANEQDVKEAQKTLDNLKYEESVRAIEKAIDALQDKIDEITAQSDLIQDQIDALTENNDSLADSIDAIQDEIDLVQDSIDELTFKSETLGWAIDDIEYSLSGLQYQIEDLNETNADLSESIRRIDEQIQPLSSRITELGWSAADLQREIDLIQESIDPLSSEIEELNRQNEELQIGIDELQEKIDEIEESLEPLQEQIEDLNEQSDVIQESIDAITEAMQPLEAEIENLNQQNDALQESIDAIDESIELLQEDLEPLNAELETLSRQNEELGEQIDLLKEKQTEETDVLREQVEAISSEIDAYNDLRDAAVESIDTQIQKIDESVAALDKEIERINAYKESIQSIFDEIEARSDEDLLSQLFGEGWEEKIKSLDPAIVQQFADGYYEAMEHLREANANIAQSLGDVETQLQETKTATDELKDSMENAEEATGQGSVLYALDSTSVVALEAAGVFGKTKDVAENLKASLNTYHAESTSEVDGLIDLLIASKRASEEARKEFDNTAIAVQNLKQIVHAEVYEMLAEIELLVGRIQTAMEVVVEEMEAAYEKISGRVRQISQEAKDMGEDVDAVLAHIDSALAVAEEQTKDRRDEIVGAIQEITNALEGMPDAADAAFGGLKPKLEGIVREIQSSIASITPGNVAADAIQDVLQPSGYHTAGGNADKWHSSGGGTVNSANNPTTTQNNYHVAGGASPSSKKQSGGGGPKTPYMGVKNIKETTLRTKAGQKEVEKWRSMGYDVQIVTWAGKIKDTLQRFGRGGVVSIGKNGYALAQGSGLRRMGEDALVAAKDGERILTKAQNEGFEELIKLTPELIKSTKELAKYAKMFDGLSLDNSFVVEESMARGLEKMRRGTDYQAPVNNTMSITIGDINITDASNADDLAIQIKNNLPNSLLQAMGRG